MIDDQRVDADERRREWWGYGVWGFVGVVIAVPELWAASGSAPWPTISATIGYLEGRWNWIALIVVALLVIPVVEVAHRLGVNTPRATADAPQRALRPVEVSVRLHRTRGGRGSAHPGAVNVIGLPVWLAYFSFSVVAVAAAIVAAHATAGTAGTRWVSACVLYGVIAVLFVGVPTALVLVLHREVPFPTLVQTLANLDRRNRPLFLLAIAAVVILLLHLAFYPWPRVAAPTGPTLP